MKFKMLIVFMFQTYFGFGQFKFQINGTNSTLIISQKIFVKYKSPSDINYKSYKDDSCQIKNGKFTFLYDAKEPVLDFQFIIGNRIHYILIDSGITNVSIKKSTRNKKNYQLIFSPSKSNDLFVRMNELEVNERKGFKISSEQNTSKVLNFSNIKRRAELSEIIKYPQDYYSLIRLYDISFHLNTARFNEINSAFIKLSQKNRILPIGLLLNQRIKNAFALLPDKDLPFFSFSSLDGQHITNKNFINDKVIFFFYATWCGPCKKIIPILKSMNEKFNKEIKFVMINLDENKGEWKKIISKFQINGLMNLTDESPMIESSNAANLLIDAVPQFMFSKNNKIVFKGILSDFEKNEILINFLNK
jgi:thiol-disulfide isomerase/thioredoxin